MITNYDYGKAGDKSEMRAMCCHPLAFHALPSYGEDPMSATQAGRYHKDSQYFLSTPYTSMGVSRVASWGRIPYRFISRTQSTRGLKSGMSKRLSLARYSWPAL